MSDPGRTQNITGGIVAVALVALIGMALWALFRLNVPSSNHDVLLVVIGFLTSNISTVVNFYFGTSSSQRKKDDTIATLATNASDPTKP